MGSGIPRYLGGFREAGVRVVGGVVGRCWGVVFGLWPGWLNEWNYRRLAGEAGYCITRTSLEVWSPVG